MIRVFCMDVRGRDFLDASWAPYLSEERKEAARRRRLPEARQMCLGAEALLNRALEAVGAGIPLPAAYTRNEYGKPYLSSESGIYVNWSHSGAYAVCAVSDTEVGVDIQEMDKEPGERLARRILVPEEYRDWEETACGERKERFYRYWTVKESFLKMKGTGFYGDLDVFRVALGTGAADILDAEGNHLCLARFLPFKEAGYLVCVCREGVWQAPDVEYI